MKFFLSEQAQKEEKEASIAAGSPIFFHILQTEWFAKNSITVIPAKAGIHSEPS